ncbi:hypothetical protein CA54_26200 [Symmachiella macrocystis]|uniref:Uncharacterized protein n=1 Tax=Symmachiella macrocystis TaxID=2527985 RepID=A0A5C6BP25_9PLAN|nr:hypothetical protein CA54_26200 [Symmachiella macrocystis]
MNNTCFNDGSLPAQCAGGRLANIIDHRPAPTSDVESPKVEATGPHEPIAAVEHATSAPSPRRTIDRGTYKPDN